MPSGYDPQNMTIAHGAFMAYVTDDYSHAVLRTFAEEVGLPPSVVQPGGIDVLTTIVAQATKLPKVILVDIDDAKDPLPAVTRLIEALEGVSRVIVIGSTNDIKIFRALLAAGAADYVVKPLLLDLLKTAYSNAGKNLGDSTENTATAKIIPIIGVRGGVGATTIAVNLGWHLAHNVNQPTALFDLDLHYGTSTLALDLTPGRGLREALQTPGRLDALLIASSMASESDKFSILGAEEPLEEIVAYEGSAISAIIGELKNNFGFILIDLPRHLLAQQKPLLAEADTVILVAEQTLAAVRDVVRLKAALKAINPLVHVLIVVSRSAGGKGSERVAQLDQAHFEKGIQDKIALSIPEDSQPVAYAANRGEALGKVAPTAPVTLAIAELAGILSGFKPPVDNQAIWSRLAQKFKKNRANKPVEAKQD